MVPGPYKARGFAVNLLLLVEGEWERITVGAKRVRKGHFDFVNPRTR